jgi:hypothetical protein
MALRKDASARFARSFCSAVHEPAFAADALGVSTAPAPIMANAKETSASDAARPQRGFIDRF